jgi:hypothetical protein
MFFDRRAVDFFPVGGEECHPVRRSCGPRAKAISGEAVGNACSSSLENVNEQELFVIRDKHRLASVVETEQWLLENTI